MQRACVFKNVLIWVFTRVFTNVRTTIFTKVFKNVFKSVCTHVSRNVFGLTTNRATAGGAWRVPGVGRR